MPKKVKYSTHKDRDGQPIPYRGRVGMLLQCGEWVEGEILHVTEDQTTIKWKDGVLFGRPHGCVVVRAVGGRT